MLRDSNSHPASRHQLLLTKLPMNQSIVPHLTSKTVAAVALMFLSALLVAGCGTGKPAGASFASVVIPGKTPEEICKTTGSVFQADGYKIMTLTPSSMVFMKEATRGQSMAYNGVVNTSYGAVTMVRVKAELVDLGNGSQRLQCQAAMVRNAGDSFFEDESRLINLRSRPYQNLLDKVAKQLK
jgi:hypothetical protein